MKSLWRYPVKSMSGEELDVGEVTQRGLVGDRVYGLVDDSDGKVTTAKKPRKWPRLLEFCAVLTEGRQSEAAALAVLIYLPDGSTVNNSQADVDAVLPRALARNVSLRAATGAG